MPETRIVGIDIDAEPERVRSDVIAYALAAADLIGTRFDEQAYRRGISASDEADAKRKAFYRASEYLIGSNRVGVWDGNVWLP